MCGIRNLCGRGKELTAVVNEGISAVDEIVKITGHPSLESVYHHLHLLLHRLYLREDRGWSRIHEG